jgi:hydrogenase expression/formation protein HypC
MMCIGTPLRVIKVDGSFAWCVAAGGRERLDMTLVGEQPAGTWVLAFHGAARQVLSEREAARMSAARQALAAVQSGDFRVDGYFADLVGREPMLPAHLLADRGGKLGHA